MTDYLEEVEAAYSKCRGKWSMLSPLDWQLAAEWEKAGIPLFIVHRAIEDCCKKFKAKKDPGKINTLRYFDQAVRQHFAGWSRARVGASTATEPAEVHEQNEADAAIERCELIIAKFGEAKPKTSPEIREALTLVIDAVFQIILYVEGNGNTDSADRDLNAIALWFDSELLRLSPDRDSVRADLEKRFPQYAGTDAYDRLLIKELYDRLNLPRLALYEL